MARCAPRECSRSGGGGVVSADPAPRLPGAVGAGPETTTCGGWFNTQPKTP